MSLSERAPESGDVARELLECLRMLEELRGFEWRKGAVAQAFESDPVRAVGGKSDPTPEVALDVRRLRVRAGVWQAWRDARALRTRLERVLNGATL